MTKQSKPHPVLTRCPVCSDALHIVRLECHACGSALEGNFSFGWLQALSREQLEFIQAFLKCRGKIKDVEQELGVSYPTVVARLNEVVQAMGFEAAAEPTAVPATDSADRKQILDALAEGRITAAEAAKQIRGLSRG